MNWPWMRRSEHKRIYVQQGEAYRREIAEARAERDRARADLSRFVDSLTPRIEAERTFPDGHVRVWFDVERRLMEREPMHDLYALIRDRIMERLFRANRDYRGDMRQTEMQRALGL